MDLCKERQITVWLNTVVLEEVRTYHAIKYMNALDHCRTTRESLRQKADASKVNRKKLIIPQDGETLAL